MNQDPSEYKEYVQQQRKKLKENPRSFIQKEMIEPTIKFWKEEPLRAAWVLVSSIMVYYLIFGGIQVINNDMIYCDSNMDKYDGKLMIKYDQWMQFQATKLNGTMNLIEIMETKKEIAEKDYLKCDYDLDKWFKEPLNEKTNSLMIGIQKIILKQRGVA